MSDWSRDLSEALATGDPASMQSALKRVPRDLLQKAVPYLEAMARNSVAGEKLEDALNYYDQLIETVSGNIDWHASRAQVYLKLGEFEAAMLDATRIIELDPGAALGYRLKAEAHDGLHQRSQAIAAYRNALAMDSGDSKSQQRIQLLEEATQKEDLLKRALNPESTERSFEATAPKMPEVYFEPSSVDLSSKETSLEKRIVDGLKQLLLRYSANQSPKKIIVRLEDPSWISAWDAALSSVRDSKVLFNGSELGVLALRARQHGAKQIIDVESFPLNARIANGIVQKNLLTAWRNLHGADIDPWPEHERRASFEFFSKNIAIVSPDSDELETGSSDHFVFPDIDHSLLGTGIVGAIRRFKRLCSEESVKILPATAKLFAVPIQWLYDASHFQLEPMNDFRWSFYPQALELGDRHWKALAHPVGIGTVDFGNFVETKLEFQCSINTQGRVDAIIYWFELDLGVATITNAPNGPLVCIKPAVQYCDSISVVAGQAFPILVTITETRLRVEAPPSGSERRRHRQLPNWYVPMLLDRVRNDAYRAGIKAALGARQESVALDIGAGCGLLSMMAAESGATRVFGCEVNSSIAKRALEVVKLNGFDGAVSILNQDCREIGVPRDMPQRADVACFELFDCSLIGEGILHFLQHARQNLLTEDARYVPLKARIRGIVIEYRLDRVLDADVNLLNPYRFSPSFINVDAAKLTYRALTEPFDIFSFDFSSATPTPEEKNINVPVCSGGTAGAVLFWFDLQLEEGIWISNSPTTSDHLHWKQGLQFLPEAAVGLGSSLPVVAKHNGSSLTFQWKQDSIPKEAFSALPRFDPRWWQQSMELEQQTQNLLQLCMQNPDEYKKVSDVAMHMAIEPAKYDIDPEIAQRFAMIFFGA